MRDALAVGGFKAKSGRSPSATESLFSCVAKRKVTRREGHPAWRLPPSLGGKSVSRGRAFRQGILPWRKGIGIHAVACPDEKESTSLSTPAARPVVPDSPPHRDPG